jgi:hypothetical protein
MSTLQPPAQSESTGHVRFVSDGHERAVQAIEARLLAEIRAAVEAEFADRFAAAGPVGRMLVRRAIEREVRRRITKELERRAPPWALY